MFIGRWLMKDFLKKRWLLFLCVALLLLCLALAFIFLIKPAGQNTFEDTSNQTSEEAYTADQAAENEMSERELYDAYSHENDPARPMLDVKVSLRISNQGSRPGAPRPQNIDLEYPQTQDEMGENSSSNALNPNIAKIRPDIVLPDVSLPDFYILNPNVENPRFTGDSYTISWKYSGGRKVTYTVLLSTDEGNSFVTLGEGITAEEYTLTFPDTPSEHCVLRARAMLDGRVYKSADTNEFALVNAPVTAPPPIFDYVDPLVQYVDLPGLRISDETGLPVWFEAENHADNAAKLIWQLSESPFVGTKESFGAENGILASGEVPGIGGEFSVDLKTIREELAKPDAERSAGTPFLPIQSVYEFYLRVVALDEEGECVGDPGRGLYFSYGAPDILYESQSTSLADNSEIRILMEMPVPYTSYKYTWKRVTPDVFNADLSDISDRVLFSGSESQEASDIIQKATRVELQVATSPYTNAETLGLAKTSGIVYSYLDAEPDIGESSGSFTYLTPWYHGLEYKEFAPSESELDAMGGIYYYVRGIFYVPDTDNPSKLKAYPSETLTIAFRATSALNNQVEQVTVKSDIPYIQFWDYYPIKWQTADYDEYYEVARHIEAPEMTFSVKCTDGFRIPSYAAAMKGGWTPEQYQALLDDRLSVGKIIHYVKAEPGFWDEFFGLLKAIYSGVSEAYAEAKASVVSLVDYIPLIGDDARSFLKAAASYVIDYGLMYIGLPPTLPNIDQLAADGMDYIMKVAVDEALEAAGVPADSPAAREITETVREQVASDITGGLEAAILAQSQNPLKVGFLRLDTSRLYQPAYVDVFVCNYSKTRGTRSGKIFVSSGNGFEIYKTRSVAIPALLPGEHLTIRVYLDHLRNKYDGYNQYFDKIYNGNSDKPYKLTVYSQFQLPDARQAAKEQGLESAPLPYVTEFTYDHDAYSYYYEREFVPADPILESDSSPNAQDYLDVP